jgi:hypothetical protein
MSNRFNEVSINSGKTSKDKWLKWFIWTIVAIIGSGFGAALVVYFAELYTSGFSSFCLTTECYKTMNTRFGLSILIINGTMGLLVSVATIGGIIVAVKNYVNSSYALAISNHITNFRIFSEFLEREILKLNRVNSLSASSFFWYNKIFPNSREGDVQLSKKYKENIDSINKVIFKSNKIHSTSEKPDFSYQKHQTKMISCFADIGIEISRMNRNDFYICEGQILRLIEKVNTEFCGIMDKDYVFESRKYI